MDDLRGFVDSLRTPQLRAVATFLQSNLIRAANLREMHFELIYPPILGNWRMKIMTEVIRERVVSKVLEDDKFTVEFQQEVDRRLRAQEEELVLFLAEGASEQIKRLSKEKPTFAGWLRALEQSSVMATWSAFESLSSDAWIYAVNSRSDLFAAKVLKAFNENLPEGMSSRSIPIGIAAKYDFDLRNCIGDIVGQRIDFTLPGEIRKAYKAAFDLDAVGEDMLRSEELKQLVLARNLIAHRSGIIDEEYKEKSSSFQAVGEELSVTNEQGIAFMEVVRNTAVYLLRVVDGTLTPEASG
jgi:hypothetical protein